MGHPVVWWTVFSASGIVGISPPARCCGLVTQWSDVRCRLNNYWCGDVICDLTLFMYRFVIWDSIWNLPIAVRRRRQHVVVKDRCGARRWPRPTASLHTLDGGPWLSSPASVSEYGWDNVFMICLSALQHHLSGTLSLSLFRTVTRSHYLNLDLKHICSPPSMLLNCPVRQRLWSHGNTALYKFCIIITIIIFLAPRY